MFTRLEEPNGSYTATISKKEDSIKLAKAILELQESEIIEKLVEEYKGYPIMAVHAALFLNSNKHMGVEEYKKIINNSNNKVKAHIKLVLSQLNNSAKKMLSRISVINNTEFSKELLFHITNYPDNFTEDI